MEQGKRVADKVAEDLQRQIQTLLYTQIQTDREQVRVSEVGFTGLNAKFRV